MAEFTVNGTNDNGERAGLSIGATQQSDGTYSLNIVGETTNGTAYPADNVKIINVTSTAAAILTVTPCEGFHSGNFEISGLSTETISITLLGDGGGAAGQPLLIEAGTPATTINGSTLGNGEYTIISPFNCTTMVFTKSGAANTATINGLLSGAS